MKREDLPEDFLPPDFPDELLEDVVGVAEFRVLSLLQENGNVLCVVRHGDEEPPFQYWMIAAEYMTALTASKSSAGFEKACELIAEGAMTYKHLAKKKK